MAVAIREAISAAGLTQERVAELVGVDQPTVSKWVRGEQRPDEERLHKIAAQIGQPIIVRYGPQNKEAAPPDWVERLMAGVMALEKKGGVTDEELAQAQARAAIYLAANTQKRPRQGGGGGGSASNA